MTDRPAAPPDPALEARIQHALGPYQDRLTPAALAEARALLTVMLTTHPVLAPLMDQVRQASAPAVPAVPDISGVSVKGGETKEAVPTPRSKPKRGKRGR
jgi:hypothetical protein